MLSDIFQKNIKVFLIVAIVLLAAFFRLYQLASIPPQASLDEVSIGYNAFSILHTGADEYGYRFPVLLRAYDDWRPALYTYFVIPFVALFGLTVSAVRMPSVILSILSVLAMYKLADLLFKNRTISLFVLLALAISPWHIYISRLGHEVNLFFSFFIFALMFFYWFLSKTKPIFLILSSFCFAVSLISYQSGKIFIPIIVLTLFVLYFKKITKNKKLLVISICLAIVVSVPSLYASRTPEALIRFKATNIYKEVPYKQRESSIKILEAKQRNDVIGQILNNRRLVYLTLPINAFASHLNPSWLFTNAHNESFKTPRVGLLYFYEIPFVLIGIFSLYFGKMYKKRLKILLTVWVVVGLLPAAITSGYPHAMRVYQIMPLFLFLTAIGVYSTFSIFRKKVIRYSIMLVVLLVVCFSVAHFYKSYFYEFPRQNSNQFQYGFFKAFEITEKVKEEYATIYVSNRYNFTQSYMFYLFYKKYDPVIYQKMGGSQSGGYDITHKIDNYIFGEVPLIKPEENALTIISPLEYRSGPVLEKVQYLDGTDSMWIVEP